MERRISTAAASLRASKSIRERTLSGYAATFDAISQDLGGFKEIIRRGAFSRTLGDRDQVDANINHAGGIETLGSTRNDSLQLRQDTHGLHVQIRLPNTTAGRDAHELVRTGTLSKMSFAFSVHPDGDEWAETPNGTLRTLTSVRLHDVSVVNTPAYESTEIQARGRIVTPDTETAFLKYRAQRARTELERIRRQCFGF